MKKNTSVSLSDFVDDVYILKALTRYNNKFKIISESVAEHSYFVAVLTLKLHDDYEFIQQSPILRDYAVGQHQHPVMPQYGKPTFVTESH